LLCSHRRDRPSRPTHGRAGRTATALSVPVDATSSNRRHPEKSADGIRRWRQRRRGAGVLPVIDRAIACSLCGLRASVFSILPCPASVPIQDLVVRVNHDLCLDNETQRHRGHRATNVRRVGFLSMSRPPLLRPADRGNVPAQARNTSERDPTALPTAGQGEHPTHRQARNSSRPSQDLFHGLLPFLDSSCSSPRFVD
jgi:hypothetical protein